MPFSRDARSIPPPLCLAQAAAGAAILCASAPAAAEGVGGAVWLDVLGGIEGSHGEPEGVRRTRTTLRAGMEGWLDSYPASILAPGIVVEVEPDAAFGAELRYRHRVIDELVIDLGPSALFVPETLVGAFAGIGFRPRLSARIELEVGGRGGAFFAGSDLPDDRRVIGQGMLVAGIRIGL